MIVIFEGITRTGKSTACKNVCNLLSSKGSSVLLLDDMLNLDSVALAIKAITSNRVNYLSDFEELLLYSVRLSRKISLISENVGAFDYILVDRFVLSVLVLAENVRNMRAELVRPIVNEVINGVNIDIMYYLTASTQEVLRRDKGMIRSRKNLQLEQIIPKMNEGFDFFYSNWSGRKRVILTDGRSELDISNEIADDLLSHL